MSKYVEVGTPKKTVGAYLKVVKALNELHALGEETTFHAWEDAIVGITGSVVQDQTSGEWRFVE